MYYSGLPSHLQLRKGVSAEPHPQKEHVPNAGFLDSNIEIVEDEDLLNDNCPW
jgi:hypothetical protein